MGKFIIEAEDGETYDIELEKDLLEANKKIALENRKLFDKFKIKTIDVMGSIGSGKTSLIENLVDKLKTKFKIAVINGDLTTTIDSNRIEKHGVNVIQINTGKECHLDANLVRKALGQLDLTNLDLIFIENVGNLICPAEFPLGSSKRVVVISITEGPYMVVKHPFIFIESDVAIINKIDLVDSMKVKIDDLIKDIEKINPGTKVVKVNCRESKGIEEVISALEL
ncbi:hydrogenase nickel incorporation protein HypB [miscellaneous Crenarchaeota group archaeon SMTZ-80]|nr:MAG: hydrogenase nickel incorporation protein HypB [miscellaneous Crenarchaeota group archaeon SMTZ-80]